MIGVTALRGRYGPAIGLVLLGLCPNVVLSTSFGPLSQTVAGDLHASATAVELGLGLGNAGYALGAVTAAQLALRFRGRALYLASAVMYVVGSYVGASAGAAPLFGVARALQGLAAGGLLVATLPQILTRFGARRLPVSAAVVNVGLFGASSLGPVVGGLTAQLADWRLLFWVAAASGVLSWVLGLVGYERFDAPDPDRRVDRAALALVLVTTTATFVATSLLTGHDIGSPVVVGLLVLGVLALGALVVVERRVDDALVPTSSLATQLPVTGTVAAMVGGAVFVGATQLLGMQLTYGAGLGPAAVALRFVPAPVGAALAAWALRRLFAGRFLPVLVDVGLALLALASVLLWRMDVTSDGAEVFVITFLLGIGAGASVSPGLFLVGLGLPADRLGRAFAMVQLLRSMATYAVAPVLLYVVTTSSAPTRGLRVAYLALVVIAALGLLLALLVPALSGARLRTPDLAAWLDGERALPSPTTGVHVRPHVTDPDAAPLVPGRDARAAGGRHRR